MEKRFKELKQELKQKRDGAKLAEFNKIKTQLWAKREELSEIKRQQASKTFEQKLDEKEKLRKGEWFTLKMIKKYLLLYSLLDFFLQIVN